MGAADAFLSSLLGGAASQATNTLTADPALDAFAVTAAKNNLYNQIATPILGAKFDQRTWSPTESLGVNLGQSFLGGLLGQLGQRDIERQQTALTSALPELYRSPSTFVIPEGVDVEAARQLQQSAIRENAVQEKKLQQSVIADLLTRQPEFAAIAPGLAKTAGVSELGEALSKPKAPSGPLSPQVAAAAKASGLVDEGREPVIEKLKRITGELLATGNYTKAQASEAAAKMVEGEIKANRSSFDSAKQARETAAKFRNVADTAEAGISALGDTGGMVGAKTVYDWALSQFGNEGAEKRRTGRGMLASIAPDVLKMSRDAGSGATDKAEFQAYLGAGPSESQSLGTNIALIQKYKNIAKINEDYADFIESYRDLNDGSIVNADKKWNQYKRDFPIFKNVKGEVVLNDERPPWQDYFAAKADPEAYKKLKESDGVVGGDVAKPKAGRVVTLPDGRKVRVVAG